jgi:hypothetical protein
VREVEFLRLDIIKYHTSTTWLPLIATSICEKRDKTSSFCQVLNEFASAEPRVPCKRLADGSKRVQVPHFMLEQVKQKTFISWKQITIAPI